MILTNAMMHLNTGQYGAKEDSKSLHLTNKLSRRMAKYEGGFKRLPLPHHFNFPYIWVYEVTNEKYGIIKCWKMMLMLILDTKCLNL